MGFVVELAVKVKDYAVRVFNALIGSRPDDR